LENSPRSDLWRRGKKKDGRRGRKPERFGKGRVIVNCGVLGLDWQTASLSDYLEALEAHGGEETSPKPITEGHRKFMKAHGLKKES
jgi:hypothetical protein